mmetsp:Transcript_28786/g.73670  ORF Transcript_28786/g.73670 Transcript_28786/m.73670 type:complete len:440 (+) Transcript_28786:3959-5278(+)
MVSDTEEVVEQGPMWEESREARKRKLPAEWYKDKKRSVLRSPSRSRKPLDKVGPALFAKKDELKNFNNSTIEMDLLAAASKFTTIEQWHKDVATLFEKYDHYYEPFHFTFLNDNQVFADPAAFVISLSLVEHLRGSDELPHVELDVLKKLAATMDHRPAMHCEKSEKIVMPDARLIVQQCWQSLDKMTLGYLQFLHLLTEQSEPHDRERFYQLVIASTRGLGQLPPARHLIPDYALEKYAYRLSAYQVFDLCKEDNGLYVVTRAIARESSRQRGRPVDANFTTNCMPLCHRLKYRVLPTIMEMEERVEYHNVLNSMVDLIISYFTEMRDIKLGKYLHRPRQLEQWIKELDANYRNTWAEDLQQALDDAKKEMKIEVQIKEFPECQMCMERKVNVVATPCGHAYCCDVCLDKLQTKSHDALEKCMYCRKEVLFLTKVFIP